MGLVLPQTVEVVLAGNIEYYENLGYTIPRRKDNAGRVSVPRGSRLTIDVMHLPKMSNVPVCVRCDICGKEQHLSYSKYMINTERNHGEYVCSDRVAHQNSIDERIWNDLPSTLKGFLDAHGRFPTALEMRKEKCLVSHERAESIALKHGTSLQELMADIDCFKTTKPSAKHYQEFVEEYKRRMLSGGNLRGMYTVWRDSVDDGKRLPRPDWMIANASADSGVTDVNSWMLWAGFEYTREFITREVATQLIMQMADAHNGILYYDDFRNTSYGEVSLHQIRTIWGSVNNMKQELGLPIIQESMTDKHLPPEVVVSQVQAACADIYKRENRRFITVEDLESHDLCQSSGSIRKAVKALGFNTVSDYIKSIGFELTKPGRGLVHTFTDGEIVYSRYELIFSTFLRRHGLVYNKDYERDVRYNTFSSCNNKCDCDYVITSSNRTLYVEIAGLLNGYKTWFLEGKKIGSSKSKEQYRQTLSLKKDWLEQSGVDYFILFPCDLNDYMMGLVLSEEYNEAHSVIDNHYKTNIDWSRIPISEGVQYDFNIKGRDNQAVVIYT